MKYLLSLFPAAILWITSTFTTKPLRAQTSIPSLPQLPPTQPLPPQPLPQPPPELPPTQPPLVPSEPQPPSPEIEAYPGSIRVNQFLFRGNIAISTEELEKVTAPFTGRPITYGELQQVRDIITNLYLERGYIYSRARLLPFTLNEAIQARGGDVTIQIIEGKVEQVNVTGSPRIRNYVRSRLRAASSPIVNQNDLLEALRLLQVDPLIKIISARLVPGTRRSTAILYVQVEQNPPLSASVFLDNDRSPAIGSFQRGIAFDHANLLGLGDRLNLVYRNTDGSNGGEARYTVPFNTDTGTVELAFNTIDSNFVEAPFNQLDITSAARSYNLSVRQPLLRSANDEGTKEFAVGLTASRVESETALLDTPFPLAAGADEQGRTRISALRFFQEYTQRSSQQVLFARSQFSLGLDLFNATSNETGPDSRFFSWLGQAVWVRPLPNNLTLLARGAVQVSDRSLVPLEQFVIGGAGSVRGYRQDALLGSNGFLASLELSIPVASGNFGEFQVIPFVDAGTVWSSTGQIPLETNTLAAVGLGVQYSLSDHFTARLDYGIPLIDINSRGNSLQENGLTFRLQYQPF